MVCLIYLILDYALTSLLFCQWISFIDVYNFNCKFLDNALENLQWFLTLFCLMYHYMLQLHYSSVTNFHSLIQYFCNLAALQSQSEKRHLRWRLARKMAGGLVYMPRCWTFKTAATPYDSAPSRVTVVSE